MCYNVDGDFMKSVVLGMSGGVDSSIAAYLLKKEGYKVIGVTFLTLPTFDDTDAKKVADALSIEHHTIDIKEQFEEDIIKSFINDYKSGITPNPCVICNKKIKFKYLEDVRKEYNADFIATGHYAKNIDGNILKSDDLNKDQTYFLSLVEKEILKHTIFPLSSYNKEEIRKIASSLNLDVATKKDSYDVCFIQDKFRDFISSKVKDLKGDIIDIETGKKIGEHSGLSKYTIGQRKGLNIGTTDRIFVVKKDVINNILYICHSDNLNYLYSNYCVLSNVNELENIEGIHNVKFRYKMEEVKANIIKENDVYILNYDSAKAVTIGQTCAIYDNDKLIGGGIIKKTKSIS